MEQWRHFTTTEMAAFRRQVNYWVRCGTTKIIKDIVKRWVCHRCKTKVWDDGRPLLKPYRLLVLRLRANGRNNSQHCCANNVGSCWPTMLRPFARGFKFDSHLSTCPWPQQCWKSCANGSNIVALRFGDHGTKEMLGVVGWKVWPVSNFAQHHATTSNNMQQGVQTDATCNIHQFWELLANNVASVCTGP